MAVETVEIRLDETWKVLSFDNAAVVSWQVTSFAEALFFVGDIAPAAGSFVGQTTRVLEPTIFGSAKVYARAVRDSAKVTIQRTVNAGNAAAAPILQALALSASTLQTTTPSGTAIGTIQNRLAGSTLTLTSSRRRLALSADGASLLVGLTPASPGKFFATIREEHPDAGARDTTLELTVTAPALSISGTPPAAVEGQDYSFTPTVTGGFGARALRLAGSLPVGWSVSSTTGAIFAPGAFVKAALSPVAGGTLTVSDETGSASLTVGAITVNAGGGASVVRATNIGSSLMEQGVMGGSIVTHTLRRPMILPFGVKRVKCLKAAFTIVSSGTAATVTAGQNHTDTLFSNNRKFQVGIRSSWLADHANAGTCIPLTFSGAPVLDVPFAGIDANTPWYESDWLDIAIPAGTKFDVRSLIVAPAGQVPHTMSGFGQNQPDFGLVNSTSDLAGGLASQTAFLQVASGGGAAIYDNTIWIFETDGGVIGKQMLLHGDSNTYAKPYDLGDGYKVSGMTERGFWNRKGWATVNLGRGSNGDYSDSIDANSAMRRKLATRIHAISPIHKRTHAMGTNDVSKTFIAPTTYANSKAYAKWDVVNSAGNGLYICTKAGTSKASGALTGAGRNIVDGTAEWALYSASTGGTQQQVARLVACRAKSMELWRTALPGVPVIDLPVIPSTTSSDNYATVANQTVATNFGNETSRRGLLNSDIRGLLDLFGAGEVIDPNPYIEDSYPPTQTSKFKADGITAQLYTPDGQHVSEFAAIAASVMVDAVA